MCTHPLVQQFLTEAADDRPGGRRARSAADGSVGVLSVGAVIPAEFAALARLDFSLLAITVVLAVVATLLAAVYPAYRASQTVYQDGKPAAIVGIVERLQNNVETDSTWEYNAVIEPLREDVLWTVYVARARPGRTTEAMREIHKALFAINPMRHMPQPWAGVHTFAERRTRRYASERGMAVLMGVICVILLGVTAAGIVGLTSFWVGQRHRQIGVRRALGARKIDILRYFQIENLLIAGAARPSG
ncbi:MAG: hypothetical protein WDW36_003221 [Sanguina aurantia]